MKVLKMCLSGRSPNRHLTMILKRWARDFTHVKRLILTSSTHFSRYILLPDLRMMPKLIFLGLLSRYLQIAFFSCGSRTPSSSYSCLVNCLQPAATALAMLALQLHQVEIPRCQWMRPSWYQSNKTFSIPYTLFIKRQPIPRPSQNPRLDPLPSNHHPRVQRQVVIYLSVSCLHSYRGTNDASPDPLGSSVAQGGKPTPPLTTHPNSLLQSSK